MKRATRPERNLTQCFIDGFLGTGLLSGLEVSSRFCAIMLRLDLSTVDRCDAALGRYSMLGQPTHQATLRARLRLPAHPSRLPRQLIFVATTVQPSISVSMPATTKSIPQIG